MLAELRPRSRLHPDRVEVLTARRATSLGLHLPPPATRGRTSTSSTCCSGRCAQESTPTDVALLIATECSRDLANAVRDQQVAAAHGITTRTLYRRRHRTLTALRDVAPQYLAAVA